MLARAGVAAREVCVFYPSDHALWAKEFTAIYQAAAHWLCGHGLLVARLVGQTRLGRRVRRVAVRVEPKAPGVSEHKQIHSTGCYESLIGYSNAEVDEHFSQMAASSEVVEHHELRLEADALILADHIGLPSDNYLSVTA